MKISIDELSENILNEFTFETATALKSLPYPDFPCISLNIPSANISFTSSLKDISNLVLSVKSICNSYEFLSNNSIFSFKDKSTSLVFFS